MSVTGHKTEKMLLVYIGKTSIDGASALKEFWDNQKPTAIL